MTHVFCDVSFNTGIYLISDLLLININIIHIYITDIYVDILIFNVRFIYSTGSLLKKGAPWR